MRTTPGRLTSRPSKSASSCRRRLAAWSSRRQIRCALAILSLVGLCNYALLLFLLWKDDNDNIFSFTANKVFNGSSIQWGKGAHVLENVCLLEEPVRYNETHNETKVSILSYNTSNGLDLLEDFRYFDFCRFDDPPECVWKSKTTTRLTMQWHKDRRRATWIPQETLFLTEQFFNPAHCLSDQGFAVAVDLYHNLWRLRANKGGAAYPNYIHRGRWALWFSWPKEDSWCRNFFRSTGLVDDSRGPVFPRRHRRHPVRQQSSSPGMKRPSVCFSRLIVPDAPDFRHPDRHQWGSVVLSSIRLLQRMAWLGTNLSSEPWREDDLHYSHLPILLYGRQGSRSRVWANAETIKELVEAQYHANIELLGSEWETLNFAAQTSLFNSYPIIIVPIGAQNANLFFARPGTKVVEVMCSTTLEDRPPVPNLTIHSRQEASNDEEWYGRVPYSEWSFLEFYTSFTRPLSIEYFVYGEYDGCLQNGKLRKDFSPKTFTVDPSIFVSFLASRLGLEKRSTDGDNN